MPIDRAQPPTNKVLLECGPEGTRVFDFGDVGIPIRGNERSVQAWRLVVYENRGTTFRPRGTALVVNARDQQHALHGCSIPLAPVSTLGEVISLYETLSQKKWPE